MDAVSNTVAVTISSSEIAATDALKNATFTIAKSGSSYTIQSKSGYYIGQTSNGNGLASNKTTKYTNSISLNGTNVDIKSSGGAYLRYNSASNQLRFRYFKSSSYTGQKAICLYKLVENTCAHEDCSWTSNAAGHYKKCNGCGETIISCTKKVAYTTTETQHTPECTCGYVGTAANHEFGNYTPVDGGHNRVCEVCEYAEATTPCVDDGTGKCGTCGTLMGCDHDWKAAHNETQHFEVCSKCNGTRNEEDHAFESSFVDDTHTDACDCGYSVTEKHVLTNGKCSCGFALKADRRSYHPEA